MMATEAGEAEKVSILTVLIGSIAVILILNP
jgi:hypothetical protein